MLAIVTLSQTFIAAAKPPLPTLPPLEPPESLEAPIWVYKSNTVHTFVSSAPIFVDDLIEAVDSSTDSSAWLEYAQRVKEFVDEFNDEKSEREDRYDRATGEDTVNQARGLFLFVVRRESEWGDIKRPAYPSSWDASRSRSLRMEVRVGPIVGFYVNVELKGDLTLTRRDAGPSVTGSGKYSTELDSVAGNTPAGALAAVALLGSGLYSIDYGLFSGSIIDLVLVGHAEHGEIALQVADITGYGEEPYGWSVYGPEGMFSTFCHPPLGCSSSRSPPLAPTVEHVRLRFDFSTEYDFDEYKCGYLAVLSFAIDEQRTAAISGISDIKESTAYARQVYMEFVTLKINALRSLTDETCFGHARLAVSPDSFPDKWFKLWFISADENYVQQAGSKSGQARADALKARVTNAIQFLVACEEEMVSVQTCRNDLQLVAASKFFDQIYTEYYKSQKTVWLERIAADSEQLDGALIWLDQQTGSVTLISNAAALSLGLDGRPPADATVFENMAGGVSP